jgi:hypothetical protein
MQVKELILKKNLTIKDAMGSSRSSWYLITTIHLINYLGWLNSMNKSPGPGCSPKNILIHGNQELDFI